MNKKQYLGWIVVVMVMVLGSVSLSVGAEKTRKASKPKKVLLSEVNWVDHISIQSQAATQDNRTTKTIVSKNNKSLRGVDTTWFEPDKVWAVEKEAYIDALAEVILQSTYIQEPPLLLNPTPAMLQDKANQLTPQVIYSSPDKQRYQISIKAPVQVPRMVMLDVFLKEMGQTYSITTEYRTLYFVNPGKTKSAFAIPKEQAIKSTLSVREHVSVDFVNCSVEKILELVNKEFPKMEFINNTEGKDLYSGSVKFNANTKVQMADLEKSLGVSVQEVLVPKYIYKVEAK